jgi:ubiquinone biosynthesis protein UbiJ
LHIGAETFVASLAEGHINVAAGPLDRADVTFTGPAAVIAGAIYGGQPLASLETQGALRIDGDRALAERFVTLFPLPEKAKLSVSSPLSPL